MTRFVGPLLFFYLLVLTGCSATRSRPGADAEPARSASFAAYESVELFLAELLENQYPVSVPAVTRLDTILVDDTHRHLDIYFNESFGYIPFRTQNTDQIYAVLGSKLSRFLANYTFTLYTLDQPIQDLIPNYFLADRAEYDITRLPVAADPVVSIATNVSKPFAPTRGLQNRHIALWHSHGWYYEPSLARWEWQRPRLFQTVEDLLTMSFTVPYLAPMLENAGARVFFPRERDVQRHEVVVDNDIHAGTMSYVEDEQSEQIQWREGIENGFAIGNPPYTQGVNPFKQGSYRRVTSDTTGSATVRWIPDLPETGEYAVYISYASDQSSVADAQYTVVHAGGSTTFLVNQQMGGGTWICLGTFHFAAGFHPDVAQVVLTNKSQQPGRVVTADAVRFGGGMGNVARNGKTSGRPRFVESARYYLQYSGMPDTLVYNVTEVLDDYRDDYQGRGEWVNYLRGAPFGPNKDRMTRGLGIPIDLSLAFHTDAGITRNDTTIGTLMIYSSDGADSTKKFPDGMSRFASRDFADLLQTQLTEDLRALYDSAWTRRSIWDKDYSEAYRPNVPSALLELLSHQNFLDMKFAQDPRFRFDASRAIYKAILKFLATQHDFAFEVQPLPVTHFEARFPEKGVVLLSWRPRSDPLESTADPDEYIVYTRIDGRGFDNGRRVSEPQLRIDGLEPGTIYSYKVTAANAGGESFPSETLSVGYHNDSLDPVLVINGFDRVSAPATLEAGPYLGFADFWDQGVPDKYDLHYIGSQYDFVAPSPWLDDDAPGHGASYANYETTVIAGNTFDFPFVHGQSIMTSGRSFVSTSDETVMDGLVDITDYRYVDLILGEEKETDWPKPVREKQFKAFPASLQTALRRFCESGGSLFISGAYVGTDLFENKSDDHPDVVFAQETLKYTLRTNYAVRTGDVVAVENTFLAPDHTIAFNTRLGSDLYAAEAPDAIEPADSNATTILRYAENNSSAAIRYQGDYNVIVFGFPFETIMTKRERDDVMRAVLASFSSRTDRK